MLAENFRPDVEMRFSPVETERGVGVDFLEFIGVSPKGQDETRWKNYHLVEKPPFSLSITI